MHRVLPPALVHLLGCALVVAGLVLGAQASPERARLGWASAGVGLLLAAWSFRRVSGERSELRQTIRSRVTGLAHQERLATVGTLAASVVHDIRNMLTSLRGNLELAQEAPMAQPDQAECITDALLAARRIEHLTSALHSYARPFDEQHRVCERLDQVAEEAIRLVRPLARRGPALVLRVGSEVRVEQPSGALQQVLVNLLQNAISVVGPVEGGRIEVEVVEERESNTARVVVEDNGPGIPDEILHQLFSPFATSRPDSGGTGLGLYISRRMARTCGGDLWAEEGVGRGARFVIRVPCTRSAPRRASVAKTAAPSSDLEARWSEHARA